jgi:hypothetical protein
MEVEVKRKGKVRHEIVASQPYMWILGFLLRGAAIAYTYVLTCIGQDRYAKLNPTNA